MVLRGKAPILSKNLQVIIFIVEQERMLTENGKLKSLFSALDLPGCRNITITLVAYLTKEDLQNLSKAFQGKKQSHFLVNMVANLHFINHYINATDKSLYFTFFDEEQYKKIEIQQIAAISQKQSHLFSLHHQAFQTVISTLKTKVPAMEDEVDMLLEMIVNPDLPLPKMKRQTQGMYCTSAFQLSLVHETFNEESEQDFFTSFEKLQQFLSIQQEEEYLKQFMIILKDKTKGGNDLKKIMKVRYTPYQINAHNFQQFFIDNNELHNFIVCLFALTDIMLQATHQYVNMIADPLHRLVELTLRYNVYRNLVLGVQEMLGFAFKMYQNIYHESIEENISKPKYKFWRPALTKWFLRMDPLHKEGQEVYMHCLIKLRLNKLKQQLSELYKTDQLRYGKLLQAVEMNNFEYQFNEKISIWGNGASELSLFFDANIQNYEIVVMEFNDYLVDISINQQTVHWCGHSDHQMEKPYLQYQRSVIDLSHDFISSLMKCGNKLQSQDIFQIVKIQADYLPTLQIKNRTLKKILDTMTEKYNLESLWELNKEQLVILGNFEQADKKLEYFNHKALILSVIDQNSRPFYSIPPHCSPKELIDMIDTNDSQNNIQDSEQIEYRSEDERREKTQKTSKRSMKKYESDQEYESPKKNGPSPKKNKKDSSKKSKQLSIKAYFLDEQQDSVPTLKGRMESWN